MANPTVKYSFWLVFQRNGSAPRCTRNSPSLAVDERAMHCTVEIPVSVFVRPTLTATIKLDEFPQQAINIDVEAAETALSEVLGAEVIFSVRQPEEGTTP